MSASIFGSVWNDLIADGIRAAGELGLAGITAVATPENGGAVQQGVSDANGDYSIPNLSAGLYTLALVLPTGAAYTLPTGPRSVTVGAQDVTGIDFGVQVPVTTNAAVQQMPSVAVNPHDANHVVMAYMDYSAASEHGVKFAGIMVATSLNGGATWQHSKVNLPDGFDQAAGHPTVQFRIDPSTGQAAPYISFMAATFLGRDSNGSALVPGVIYDATNQTVNFLPTSATNPAPKTVSRRLFSMHANNGIFVASPDVNGNWVVVGNHVSSQRYDAPTTALTSGIAAGATVLITPSVMPANLFVNKALVIDEGLASMERVIVTAFTATTFTAKFNKAHAAGNITINTPVFFDAQPDLAIDVNPDSPLYGNMYMTWTRFYPASQFPGQSTAQAGTQIMLAVSTDGGQTWNTRRQPNGISTVSDPRTGTSASNFNATEGAGTNTLPRVAVGPEGGVYVSQFAGNRFPVFYSDNAGVSFRNPIPDTLNTDSPGYPFGVDSDQFTAIYPAGAGNANFVPAGTLANNSFRTQAVRAIAADPVRPGYVYAVEAQQIITTAGAVVDRGEITFARSTDYGVTWTRLFTVEGTPGNFDELPENLQFRYRSVLNDENDGRFTGFDTTLQDEVIAGQAMPQLSVDAQGNIAVIWYDTRRDPGNKLIDVFGTISTDGGQTFSANHRLSAANFNADTGAFSDARNTNNFYLGDRLGLALASNGTAYAAWTGTDGRANNQDLFFTSYDLSPAPAAANDRYEPNETSGTATDLGRITAARIVPRLSLATGEQDWYRIEAGATGNLLIQATAPGQGSGLRLELYDDSGKNLLASGTDFLAGDVVIGQALTLAGVSGVRYRLRISGDGAAVYSMLLQSLTGSFGTSLSGAADGTIAAGSTSIYSLAAAVGGSFEVALTPGVAATGNLTLQVLSADGQTVLASLARNPAKSETERLTLPVDQGQPLLLQVTGAASSTVLINGAPVVLANGALPNGGTAIIFSTPVNSSVATLQASGNNATRVRVERLNTAGAPVETKEYDLLPGAAPIQVINLIAGAGFRIRSLNPVGTGPFHLDFVNRDIFQTSSNSIVYPTGAPSASVAAADLNDDDIPDLVLTSTQGGDFVRVMLGNADGTFQTPRQFAVGAGQAAISAREPILADFNGDGLLDIAVPNYFSADVSILLGNGDGTFAPQRRFDAVYKANSAVTGDFNGDGNLDLAVMDRTPGAATVAILSGRGDGTFLPPDRISIPFDRGDASPVRVGDLNHDGLDDLVAFGANDGELHVLLGQSTGAFAVGGVFATGEVLFDAQLADIDGDHNLDVLVGGGQTGRLIVLLGNGDGTFQDPDPYGTAPRIGNDNIGVVGLAVADIAGPAGLGADGRPDVIVTTRYRSNSDVPQAFILPGAAPGASKLFDDAVRLGALKDAGRIAIADFDGDGGDDVAITEAEGVRVVYAAPPDITPNITPADARDLGIVVHALTQRLAIVPGFEHAYYTLTVPSEAAAGSRDQVLDFSALFQFTQGAGLQMEVLDADGNVLGTGSRFRAVASQGDRLTVHVFGVAGGVGAYTLVVDVLPQVVSIEAQSLLAAADGSAAGAVTSLVLTLQGDRLDPATAENPDNYIVTLLSDGTVYPLGAPGGAKAVIYHPGANVDVSTGRTFPTAVRQTITLLFDQPLPASPFGASYRVELSPAIKTANFNAAEPSLLAAAPGFSGHALVTQVAGQITEGAAVDFQNVVQQTAATNLDAYNNGTSFMTQLHNDLGATLDALLARLGDDPSITQELLNTILARVQPGWDASAEAGQLDNWLIVFLDPVSIDLADPGGNRAVFNLRTNTVSNNLQRTFVEVGGNVQVMVMAAVSGTFTLNIGDVQPTARGGAIVQSGGQVQSLSLTEAMRAGQQTFAFDTGTPNGSAPGAGVPSDTGLPIPVSALNALPSVLAALTPTGAAIPTTVVAQTSLDFSLLQALVLTAVTSVRADHEPSENSLATAVREITAGLGEGVAELGALVSVVNWAMEDTDDLLRLVRVMLVGLGMGDVTVPAAGVRGSIKGIARAFADSGNALASQLFDRVRAQVNGATTPVNTGATGNGATGNGATAPTGNGVNGNGGPGNGAAPTPPAPQPQQQPEEEVSSLEAASLLSVAQAARRDEPCLDQMAIAALFAGGAFYGGLALMEKTKSPKRERPGLVTRKATLASA